MKKQKGNQWYRDTSNRSNGTYCGADETAYDITWRDKAENCGEYTPCLDCIKERK